MKVLQLKHMLARYNDEDWVEFHDKTMSRKCPINSSYVKDGPTGQKILVLCNTLGNHKG